MSLSSRIDRVLQGNPEGLEAFQQLSLAEMAETRVTFGKTHVGKTYEELWNQEKGWIKWFCKTYQDSTKEEHRKLLIYVEKKVERLELEHELPTLTEPTVQQGIVRPRSKAMPKGQVCIDSTSGDRDFGQHEHQRGDLGTVGCDHANGWSRNDLSAGEH